MKLADNDWRRKYIKWWALMLILICMMQTVPHAMAQGGCGVWSSGEGQGNRLLYGGAAVGALVGFLVGGPFGLGIVIGGLLVGGIAGANDIAMTMAGC